MSMAGIILAIIAIIVVGFVGIISFVIGKSTQKKIQEKDLDAANGSAKNILVEAKKKAETVVKEATLSAQEKNHRYRSSVEKELKNRRAEIQKQEDRLLQREEALDRKDSAFERRESTLNRKEQKINREQQNLTTQQEEANSLIQKRQAEVEKVAAFTQEEARNLIIQETSEQLADEKARMVKESYYQAQSEADENAKDLIIEAIQQSSADVVSETTVSVVSLPNEDMKGRIIGREGRNIRTFETLTGIDLIIDDTPQAVVLSGFDPIRREVAKMTLEKLIKDGRIHPARIEEMVEKSRKELDERIQDIGEETLFDLGIHSMSPEMIKLVGQMNFKIFHGQNLLGHSIEVAKLTGAFASELGEDVTLAKRAGLLHDIGKAANNGVEGSHVQVGVDLAKKYHESPVVIDAIKGYDEDHKPESIIAELVAVAGKIAISRPGAHSDSLESFVHRLDSLEKITDSFDEVQKSYAIQAGREIRVIAKPEDITDTQAIVLARKIKQKIETKMKYPGHIKVTVIREVRSVEYAR
ncbi:ribonuclease Y [Lentilactobacillus sp. IMAU92037]|uniref:ribonuclease Y n=1 Tax=Lentilactobacillus dabitei TaxID=2831523 RepID=UPI001C26298E|nr:ribonuclease Y [Lentilactobacillus dabitei]MBU9788103.1 ribonuclease Y [Lentilactobacillus dabitei]MBV0930022.1 ribonuclease Y [Lentilactobacillus dabitei]